MKIKTLKEKHPIIYNRILECQVEQGNEPNDELTLLYGKDGGNFFWDETKEGYDIWHAVNNENFQPFYDFHKLPNPDKEAEPDLKERIKELEGENALLKKELEEAKAEIKKAYSNGYMAGLKVS